MRPPIHVACLIALCSLVYAQESNTQESNTQPSASETTLEDQTDVAITIYNNNLALVRDRRSIQLPTGEIALNFSDVASAIKPETVSLRSISAPGSLRILEQNYEYDLMSPSKLMEKYVGRNVRLITIDENGTFAKNRLATLLSINEGPIYQVGEEIFLGHPGTVVLPEIPENLIAKPSLVWLLDNEAGDQEIEATYLTNGIAWRADYVVNLDRSDTSLDIDAWVTLDNHSSGATYTNAKLKLVAGEVNLVLPKVMAESKSRVAMRSMAVAGQMQEESFAEYHLYTLPRRTTIKERQSKQVSLFNAAGIAVKKVYEYRGQANFYHQRMPPRPEENVGVMLVFQNAEANQLGVPLPGGIMRIYQEDSEGMLQFAGEDRIKHTAKDEEVRLRMGKAFDVVAERIQTDFNQISPRVIEVAFEIRVRNHKETPVTVDVIEPMPGDWTVLSSSHTHQKKDAFTAIFSLDVAVDGETVLVYRTRIRF